MLTCCPEPAELARLGRGADAGSCPPEWSAHIEDCPRCRDFLDRCAVRGLDSFDASRTAGTMAPGMLPSIDGFTIERELGRGAMGVVCLAHRDMPKRQVALKLLPGGRRAGSQERRQWLREAEAAAAVRHPHIVTLYEAIVTDDWFLLALEYVPGGTLGHRLTEPLLPRTAARMAEMIARAVHHIHRSGLLHLDLKPSNILLDGDGGAGWDGLVPKVTDFGIARAVDAAATDTGGALLGGTPSYMAPEQVTSPRIDMTAAADIHGMGAILYHMLTGRPPYQGATFLDDRPGAEAGHRSAAATPSGDPARPRDHLPQVPSQGPGPALLLGRGAGRRLEPLARRTTDRGAAGIASGEELALVPPPAGDRGARGDAGDHPLGQSCRGGRTLEAGRSELSDVERDSRRAH